MLKDDTRDAADASAVPASLTAFDWLNTFVDEMLLPGDGPARPQPAPGAPAAFAYTMPLELPVGPGESSVIDREVLSRALMGYAPMVDRQGAVIATRLTVVPINPRSSIDAAALLRTIGLVWPEDAGAVSLNVASRTLIADLLQAVPARNVMIEVPVAVAEDERNIGSLRELASRGNILLLKGRPARGLPREVLQCFLWSIVDVDEERRSDDAPPPEGMQRRISYVQSGVRTMSQFRESIARGAVAVLGWPMNELDEARPVARFDLQVLIELINRIDRRESIGSLERVLVRDPVLAFRLMRYASERHLGLQVETSSFRHAITMLGHTELRRWLALMLSTCGDEHFLQPINYAALRRGLFMRELHVDTGDDETRGELFMCGVFSLLDRLLGKPMDKLLSTLVVPDRARQALVERRGPFMPMLRMACAVESERPDDIRAAAEALYLEPMEVNKALVRALTAGRQVGG